MALLELKDLHVSLEGGAEIVKGVDLTVSPGEIHALMGPNGSGKSSLAYALMGHPAYEITGGEAIFDGQDISEMGADERAQAGLFLAFQYPHAIPGVTVTSWIRWRVRVLAWFPAVRGDATSHLAREEWRTAMSMTGTPVDNGVNVAALLGAREALTAAPEAAQFTVAGQLHLAQRHPQHVDVERFFGLGEEQQHKQEYTFDADHPEIFASEDNGATPVEYVLVALASCLTAGVAAVAQNREIQLRSVSATLEGDMDVSGILGIDSDIRNGFSGIKVTYDIDADATADEIKALVAQSQKRSAVYDIITNPTNVTVEVR